MTADLTWLPWVAGLVVAVLVLVLLARAARRPRPRADHFAAALSRMICGDRDGALTSLRRAIDAGHRTPDAYLLLGNLLRERGEAQAAYRVHQTLTVRSDLPRDERRLVLRSLVEDLRALDRHAEALEHLRELARLGDTGLHMEIARAALAAGDRESAIAAVREARRAGEVDAAEAANFLADVARQRLERGDVERARALLQRALKEDENCEAALRLLGDLARRDGDHETALYYWQKLAFARPVNDPRFYEELEKTYFELGRFGDVERVYAQILDKRPRDVQVLLAAARLAKKKGDTTEAESYLRQALEVRPDSMLAVRMLAELFLEENRPRELRELLETLPEGVPSPGTPVGTPGGA